MPIENISDGSFINSSQGVVSHSSDKSNLYDEPTISQSQHMDLTPHPPADAIAPSHTPITGSIFERLGDWASHQFQHVKEAVPDFPPKHLIKHPDLRSFENSGDSSVEPSTTSDVASTDPSTDVDQTQNLGIVDSKSNLVKPQHASIQDPISTKDSEQSHSFLSGIGDWLAYKNHDYTYHYKSDNKSTEKSEPKFSTTQLNSDKLPASSNLPPTAEEQAAENEDAALKATSSATKESLQQDKEEVKSSGFQLPFSISHDEQQQLEQKSNKAGPVDKLEGWISSKFHLGDHAHHDTINNSSGSVPQQGFESVDAISSGTKVKPSLDQNPDAKPKYNAQSPEHGEQLAPKTLDNTSIEKADRFGDKISTGAGQQNKEAFQKTRSGDDYDSLIL